MNTTLQSLITYLNANPEALYDILYTPYRWEIIDLFMLDIDRPEHWEKIRGYDYNMISIWNVITNREFWSSILAEYTMLLLVTNWKDKTLRQKFVYFTDKLAKLDMINSLYIYIYVEQCSLLC